MLHEGDLQSFAPDLKEVLALRSRPSTDAGTSVGRSLERIVDAVIPDGVQVAQVKRDPGITAFAFDEARLLDVMGRHDYLIALGTHQRAQHVEESGLVNKVIVLQWIIEQ